MKTKIRYLFNLLVALSMLLGTTGSLAAPAIDDGPQPPVPSQPETPTQPGGVGARPNPMTKLDSELQALAAEGGDEPVLVYILAETGTDLSKVADVTETRPFLGQELIVANVTPAMLAKMASNPGVVSAEAFHAIESPGPLVPGELTELTREEARTMREQVAAIKANPESATPRKFPGGAAPAASMSPNSPESWFGNDTIGASDAWAKGYTGTGVNIAIIDSGVDFGHPDLDGRQATYNGGPYDGWPIALDPRSMREYLYNGNTGWDNYYDWWDYSWYADVVDVIHCTEGLLETFDFNGYTYSIDPAITAMSKSGEIRWSVHPDEQLADFVYDWTPFILLDTTTAGVYDTVIADLNFDLWFDGYDDVADKADPVLSQDIGSYVYTDTLVMTGTVWSDPFMNLLGIPPTWWGPDYTSVTTETIPAGSFIWALDRYSAPGATDGADDMPEISGGMVYYIADGVNPVPGMDYLYPESGIPFNGQLVAFMIGSYWAGGGEHGTLCASAAVAGGVSKGFFAPTTEWIQYDPADFTNFPYSPSGDPGDIMPFLKTSAEGTVQGPAPDARIIAIGDSYQGVNGMQGMYDAYTFLAYGVDGVPNSGDEFVDIVSMSYGDGSVHNDGWDWESRMISYFNQQYLPNTTFFASSGNGGPGYGTINSPQGNTTVSVGASSQYGSTDVFGGGLAASQINDGDVSSFSGRGPDAMGRPDPEVVANGAWGTGDVPLNLAPGYGAYAGWYVQDGHNAWYEWGGTSRAAPEAAGVMALIYDAYYQANGSFPDFETARQILMSGADDMSHDVLIQGAGRVNADRGTDVAGGLAGVYVEPSLLAAGEYDGTHYESFANVLYPGDSWDQTFTVHNTGASTATVAVGDEVLVQMEVVTYTQIVTPYLGLEDYYPDTYYYFADYFVGGDPTTTTHGADLAIPVPAGADFMEVQLVVPFEVFDFNYNDPDPWSVSYSANQRWSLTVYDWTDRDGDGVLWEDFSADGVVNPQQTTVSTLIYQEAFEGAFPPAGWTLHNNGGCGDWESTATTGRTNYTGGSGDAADADSDWCGSGMDTELWTPSIDLSDAIDPVLSFNTYFNSWYNDDHGYVDISIDGGTVWTNLLDYNDDVGPNWTEQIDLSAYAGEADVMLRFHYTAPGWDWYWEVDDVTISSQSVNDELDISYTGPTTMTEINRFTYGYNYANVQEAVVRLGDRTDIDNIVIGIVHRNPNNTRPGWGADEYQANPLLVKVVFYEKAGWDLVMESPTSLNVPAGGSATFEATFAVPADQAPGLYEGAITVDDGTHVSIIPTTVNVAVPGDDLLFTLGGEDDSMTPYDNANMERGYTWSGVLEEGDWRFFFYDADAGFDQQYLYVQNQWGELCSNMPTWNETLVWGPNPGDQYSLLEPDKYGPYGLQFAGGTPRANDWTMAPRNGFWWQNGDGTPLPESRAWATLWDGLNQVQFRNVLLSGQFDCGEGYEATAGVFGVDAPETGLQINTDRLSGSFVVDAVSPVDGLQVYAYGFGDEEWFQNQDVPQGKHFEEWPDDLFSGWVYEFEASNNNAIEIETFGPWSSDIDLYLMYDANGDGLYNMYDNREAVASSYTWGSEEHIWFNGSQGIPFVADGTYAVIMYGSWVEPGDQFDLRLNTYGGEGLAFEGVQGGYASLDTVPGEPESLVVNYEVPDNGIFNGYLVFGMPWEEEPENWWMGPGIFVPVTINANGVEFTYSSKVVDQEVVLQSSGTGNDVTLTYTITLVNDGVEDMFVRMVDLIPEGTTIYEQWVQDPDDPAGDGWWYTMKVSFDNGSTWYEWYTEDCWDNYNNGEYLCWTGNVGPSTSGKVYIEYTVKVLPHFAGEIMNKADVWMDWGDYHDFFSLKAFTDVLYAVYLPIVDFK